MVIVMSNEINIKDTITEWHSFAYDRCSSDVEREECEAELYLVLSAIDDLIDISKRIEK